MKLVMGEPDLNYSAFLFHPGVFVAQNDVGVGTIVGSAVFNILCIIGICALFGGRAIQLTWWPLCRDSFYYLIAVIALIAVAYDSVIHWLEIHLNNTHGVYIVLFVGIECCAASPLNPPPPPTAVCTYLNAVICNEVMPVL